MRSAVRCAARAARAVRAVLAALAVAMGSACFPPLPEVASLDRVEAFCDVDDAWNLVATVSHPGGADAVLATWVEVGYAFYDENDEPYTEGAIGEPVDLAPVDGADGTWSARVLSDPRFLDCDYPYEYWFLFVAEDDDGDRAGRSVVN